MGTCCSSIISPKSNHTFPKKSIKMSQEIRRILEDVDFDQPFKKTEKILEESEIEQEYVKQKILGTGLFSKVYLVRTKRKELMAMKVIKKKDFKTRDQIKKIITEKELMRILRHRNILLLRNTFQTKDKLYLILEYAAKGRLMRESDQTVEHEDVLARRRNPDHCGADHRRTLVHSLEGHYLWGPQG
jgi:serine/threonine protein kinase